MPDPYVSYGLVSDLIWIGLCGAALFFGLLWLIDKAFKK